MYAFPNVKFSDKVLQRAKDANLKPDVYYCFEVLKATGIVLVPGRL